MTIVLCRILNIEIGQFDVASANIKLLVIFRTSKD